MVSMYTITKSTLIGDIMDNAPEVAPLFLSIGMHCLGCPSSRGESLEEACQVHGVDADAFLEQVIAWQQSYEENPEAAQQDNLLNSLFGFGSYGDYWGGAPDLYGMDSWGSIDEELAAFGITDNFNSFSTEFSEAGQTVQATTEE